MSYEVIIDSEAEADLKNAAGWMGQYSPEKATIWYFEMLSVIDSLQNMPFRCPLAPESTTLDTPIRHLIVGKYRILFVVLDEKVFVLRVRHSAQDVLQIDE